MKKSSTPAVNCPRMAPPSSTRLILRAVLPSQVDWCAPAVVWGAREEFTRPRNHIRERCAACAALFHHVQKGRRGQVRCRACCGSETWRVRCMGCFARGMGALALQCGELRQTRQAKGLACAASGAGFVLRCRDGNDALHPLYRGFVKCYYSSNK